MKDSLKLQNAILSDLCRFPWKIFSAISKIGNFGVFCAYIVTLNLYINYDMHKNMNWGLLIIVLCSLLNL